MNARVGLVDINEVEVGISLNVRSTLECNMGSALILPHERSPRG